MAVTPQQLAEAIKLVLEQDGEEFDSFRHLNKELFAARLAEEKVLEGRVPEGVKDPAKRVLRRIYYFLYVMDVEGYFLPLPLEKDSFDGKSVVDEWKESQ